MDGLRARHDGQGFAERNRQASVDPLRPNRGYDRKPTRENAMTKKRMTAANLTLDELVALGRVWDLAVDNACNCLSGGNRAGYRGHDTGCTVSHYAGPLEALADLLVAGEIELGRRDAAGNRLPRAGRARRALSGRGKKGGAS